MAILGAILWLIGQIIALVLQAVMYLCFTVVAVAHFIYLWLDEHALLWLGGIILLLWVIGLIAKGRES